MVHTEQPAALMARKIGAKSTSVAKVKYRWYQVRPKDSWSSIAKRELGDEKRWRELHQLNRKAFPDPDRIRPGVKVKLPAGSESGRVAAGASRLPDHTVLQ